MRLSSNMPRTKTIKNKRTAPPTKPQPGGAREDFFENRIGLTGLLPGWRGRA